MDSIKKYHKDTKEYPKRLKELPGMPEWLYVIGELPSDDVPSIAIVGARDCSNYGKNMAYEYARILGKAGVQIISGLARGIDTAAHEGALAGGGKTFGVLGCGVDICYPASSYQLREHMKHQGGVLSELENGKKPLAYHFPRRNRIISGLADGVLVIEAKEKSGSLITADQALEQGKTVFALPGRVGDLLSIGCNRLIYQGAVPAWKPEIILEEMNWRWDNRNNLVEEGQKNELGLARLEELLYSCLDLYPKSVNLLQEETGLTIGEIMTTLMHLQIKGCAKEVWKGNYIKCRV